MGGMRCQAVCATASCTSAVSVTCACFLMCSLLLALPLEGPSGSAKKEAAHKKQAHHAGDRALGQLPKPEWKGSYAIRRASFTPSCAPATWYTSSRSISFSAFMPTLSDQLVLWLQYVQVSGQPPVLMDSSVQRWTCECGGWRRGVGVF